MGLDHRIGLSATGQLIVWRFGLKHGQTLQSVTWWVSSAYPVGATLVDVEARSSQTLRGYYHDDDRCVKLSSTDVGS